MQSATLRNPTEENLTESSDVDVVDVDRLFRKHASYVAAFLRRLGVAPDSVDDALQEVFLVAHARGGYRAGPASARTWLGAITIRVAANARRARQRRRETFDDRMLEQPSVHQTPDVIAEHRQELNHVERALRAMNEVHRDVFLRFAVAGHSCDDIARATGVPTGTVYSRLHAARNSFAQVRVSMMSAA
jgi:RNA polymerase sigma-70 factor (ECF subfamily)